MCTQLLLLTSLLSLVWGYLRKTLAVSWVVPPKVTRCFYTLTPFVILTTCWICPKLLATIIFVPHFICILISFLLKYLIFVYSVPANNEDALEIQIADNFSFFIYWKSLNTCNELWCKKAKHLYSIALLKHLMIRNSSLSCCMYLSWLSVCMAVMLLLFPGQFWHSSDHPNVKLYHVCVLHLSWCNLCIHWWK